MWRFLWYLGEAGDTILAKSSHSNNKTSSGREAPVSRRQRNGVSVED